MSPPLAHLGAAPLEPLQLAGLAVAGLAYARRAWTLAARGRPVPGARKLAFAGGLVLVAAALFSPLAHLGEELVVGHMAQHLVILDLAALLIVCGLTRPLLAPVLSLPGAGRLVALAHPLPALALWALNLYLWHIPPLYEATLTSPVLHALEHACFLGFGILAWMPLLGPLPRPEGFGHAAALAYVVALRFAGAGLANVLLWSSAVLYPAYARGEGAWALDPLTDQALAGGLMLAEGAALTLAALAWLFVRASREAERSQRLVELARARGVPLDPGRARRAVGAGQESRLRERLDSPSG